MTTNRFATNLITRDGGQTWVWEDKDGTVLMEFDGVNGTVTILGESAALLALLADLPTENVASPAIWNDAGVLKVGSA